MLSRSRGEGCTGVRVAADLRRILLDCYQFRSGSTLCQARWAASSLALPSSPKGYSGAR